MPRESGICQCGCGEPTKLATKTERKFGRIAGQPLRFIKGHGHTRRKTPRRSPDGCCTVPGCRKPSRALSLCEMHRWRWRKYGSFDQPSGFNPVCHTRKPKVAPVLELLPPSCDAAALYRAEKERAIPRLRSRQAQSMDEAKQAYERLQAIDAQRAKGGRPRKQSA